MKLPPWQPGLKGLIYLPAKGSLPKQRKRPYSIYYIDAKGQLIFRDGPMTCTEAYERVEILAEKEGIKPFGCPEGDRYKRLISQGYLKLKSDAQDENETAKNPDRNQNSKGFTSSQVLKNNSQLITNHETFDYLFDNWAEEAVQVAGFTANKPKQNDRIPIIIKKKVVRLWEKSICYPDKKPARFRMLDNKRGGPYSWFSYYKSNQTIYPNWEYFVQVAAFHDLIIEYGYVPEWLIFEYHEIVPPVEVAVDICVKLPDGSKIFVEVKENKSQWEALISDVRILGNKGVNLSSKDRGNDPLRKAKYIAAGRPDFFVGYCPDGFDSYKVRYSSGMRFSLEPSELPHAKTFVNVPPSNPEPNESSDEVVGLIERLITFLQEGFDDPIKIFDYLQSRKKCFDCNINCKTHMPNFFESKSWDLEEFFQWSWSWYTSNKYEEPINIVFILSRVAQFLEQELGLKESEILNTFKMEFKGSIKGKEFPVPPCLWKGVGGIEVSKKFIGQKSVKGLACDFYLLKPFPPLIAEVKVAVPQRKGTNKQYFYSFLKDLDKCKKWLHDPYVEKRFGHKFKYALAILIDMSGKSEIREKWSTDINEEELLKDGIFARLISPFK